MRPAAATAVLGLALAIGAPTAWAVSRPDAAAGPSVQRVLEGPDAVPRRRPGPPSFPR
ncbi:hypothetical protein [Blastococcus saxobsidens]|uniref:Uncharacterized protein n=1 Tax=Blastococcus saxobsidens TaxID=138336 RepID=A0A4Q7Y9W6_9ACTN|nr:hypothetical protein [Blastococcus saxobsidens]RZU33947.1 hypothetical protein BKA19_3692 [Blastococcus saxobsidens]